jgi:hypothetical protein
MIFNNSKQVFFILSSDVNVHLIHTPESSVSSFSSYSSSSTESLPSSYFSLSSYSHFFIPPLNIYSLENTSSDKAAMIEFFIWKNEEKK